VLEKCFGTPLFKICTHLKAILKLIIIYYLSGPCLGQDLPSPARTQQIHNRHGHARRRELGLRSLCVAAALQAALVLLHGTACISATGSWSTYTIVQLRRGQTSQHDAKLRGQPARRRTYGTGQDTATGVGTA